MINVAVITACINIGAATRGVMRQVIRKIKIASRKTLITNLEIRARRLRDY